MKDFEIIAFVGTDCGMLSVRSFDELRAMFPADDKTAMPMDYLVLEYDAQRLVQQVREDETKALLANPACRVLSLVRSQWYNLPIIVQGDGWSQYPLVGKFTCALTPGPEWFLAKIADIMKLAVIGVRVPEHLRAEAIEVLRKLNQRQNHFHFVYCSRTEDLFTGHRLYDLDPRAKIALFRAWSARIMGLIEDVALQDDDFELVLPFPQGEVRRFFTSLSEDVGSMGEEYLEPFLLRECARAAYRVFFNSLEGHIWLKKTPQSHCIFNFTRSALGRDGIKKGEIYRIHISLLNPRHAFGGWSYGREKAAETILLMAKDALNVVKD